MSEPIFDRALLRQRRLRAIGMAQAAIRSGRPPAPDFLLDRAVEDVVWRLSAIKRQFARAVVLNGFGGLIAERLRGAPSVGSVIEAETRARPVDDADVSGRPSSQRIDDEILPFDEASLDLIVSCLDMHWINDLPGLLVQARRALKPDGLMIAALMGGRTLSELREALLVAEVEIEGGASPRVAPFAGVRDLGALLQRAKFALPVTDVDTVTATYADPLALMHDLRAMGAGNVLSARSRKPLRRTTLARAIEVYRERFGLPNGRIPATFEIVTLTGWAPHDSQPRPLAPGSARVRLADALGTREHPLSDTNHHRRRPVKD